MNTIKIRHDKELKRKGISVVIERTKNAWPVLLADFFVRKGEHRRV